MSMNTLKDLYVHELKDLCDAERQLVEALPKMRDAADSPELRNAFDVHLAETKGHFAKLKGLLDAMNEKGRMKCSGMEGLIEEGSRVLREKSSPVKDAALIAAAQRVEHYEMAGYGTVRAYADMIGDKQAASVLGEILEQESQANETLNEIAMSEVNRRANTAA